MFYWIQLNIKTFLLCMDLTRTQEFILTLYPLSGTKLFPCSTCPSTPGVHTNRWPEMPHTSPYKSHFLNWTRFILKILNHSFNKNSPRYPSSEDTAGLEKKTYWIFILLLPFGFNSDELVYFCKQVFISHLRAIIFHEQEPEQKTLSPSSSSSL